MNNVKWALIGALVTTALITIGLWMSQDRQGSFDLRSLWSPPSHRHKVRTAPTYVSPAVLATRQARNEYVLALQAKKSGHILKAIAHLESALRIHPFGYQYDVHQMMVRWSMELGETDRACVHYEKLLNFKDSGKFWTGEPFGAFDHTLGIFAARKEKRADLVQRALKYAPAPHGKLAQYAAEGSNPRSDSDRLGLLLAASLSDPKSQSVEYQVIFQQVQDELLRDHRGSADVMLSLTRTALFREDLQLAKEAYRNASQVPGLDPRQEATLAELRKMAKFRGLGSLER